jgi:hypothetical protein
VAAAAAVFAGVFDIDGEAAEVFEENFRGEAAVAARATGGNQDFACGVSPGGEATGYFGLELVVVEIQSNGSRERVGLFVDLAQHLVRKIRHCAHCIGSSPDKEAKVRVRNV